MPPRKRRVEDACAPKRGEAPEKEKEDGKTAKKQRICAPGCYQLFGLPFSLKKERRVEDPFPQAGRAEDPEEAGRAEREREKTGKKRRTFALLFAFSFAF